MLFKPGLLLFLLTSVAPPALSQTEGPPLTDRHWLEARTAHFHTFSCGSTQSVAKLAARLEQFRAAYLSLAGTQAVVSPPIVVMAFPDRASLRSFLPLYEGKPANLAGFFKRGPDENLIALPLSGSASDSLEIIFHEYAHLLLRRNERLWPIWLNEGMADVYATFEVTGSHGMRIGKPQALYLKLLESRKWQPLTGLFAVNHDSPEYNEREHQGLFYAQSWLLTHYLMVGAAPVRRSRFGQFTVLLRQGQTPLQAFTNALQTSFPAMEQELHGYLERGRFEPLDLPVKDDLLTPQPMLTRSLSKAEVCFRLGDQLLRINRLEDAEGYFVQARQLAPESPWPYEGLGLLAGEREKPVEAVRWLGEALKRGSTSFLAHYAYARERLRQTANGGEHYSRLPPTQVGEIRAELGKSLALMPDFGPAHHLAGLVELLQEDNLVLAEQEIRRAIQLEPENPAYQLSLAQAQLERNDLGSARQTLQPLCRAYVDSEVRRRAQELLRAIDR